MFVLIGNNLALQKTTYQASTLNNGVHIIGWSDNAVDGDMWVHNLVCWLWYMGKWHGYIRFMATHEYIMYDVAMVTYNSACVLLLVPHEYIVFMILMVTHKYSTDFETRHPFLWICPFNPWI